MPLSLLDLPGEMALGIADELSPGDINALMQTHSQFTDLLAPALMRSACSAKYGNCGKKALFSAASREDHYTIKRLTFYGLLDHVGREILVHAVLCVDEKGIRTLLECGIEANVLNDNMSPLRAATEAGRIPAIRLLIARDDIDVNAKSQCPLNPLNDTILHHAAATGHLDIVRLLLGHPKLIRDVTDKFDWSALHRACRSGWPDVVQCLLEDGGFRVTAPDCFGNSPLHLVAERGNDEVVTRLLLDLRTSVNQLGKYGRTALLTAVNSQNRDAVRALLKHPDIDVNTSCNDGWTPLISAIKAKDSELVHMLVTEGRNIDLGMDRARESPLHVAVTHEQYDTVKLLLGHGVNPDIEDHNRDSPFVLAVNLGREEIVRLFLSRSCVDLEKLDNSKMSVRIFRERYIDGVVRTLDQVLLLFSGFSLFSS